MHFVCCGLPLLAAIAGVASPFAGIVSPLVMNILLVISGVAVIASWIFHLRSCDCNTSKLHKSLLIISSILFLLALIVHFVIPMLTGIETCH
jgi:hypothetical protein